MIEWIIQAETIGNISDGYWYGNGEEIVRCKDCKVKDDVRCPWWHGVPSDEFYCAWGERRGNETD